MNIKIKDKLDAIPLGLFKFIFICIVLMSFLLLVFCFSHYESEPYMALSSGNVGLVLGFTALALRFVLREKMMKKLATDFKLDFYSKLTELSKFYPKNIFSRIKYPDMSTNHIYGILNGKKIHIYDVIGSNFYSNYNFTVIEINDKSVADIESLKWFKVGSFVFSSIFSLRKLLKNIGRVAI